MRQLRPFSDQVREPPRGSRLAEMIDELDRLADAIDRGGAERQRAEGRREQARAEASRATSALTAARGRVRQGRDYLTPSALAVAPEVADAEAKARQAEGELRSADYAANAATADLERRWERARRLRAAVLNTYRVAV